MLNKRIEELQEYFRQHNKSKEHKAHTAKVKFFVIECGVRK